MEQTNKPKRLFVDLTFWLGNSYILYAIISSLLNPVDKAPLSAVETYFMYGSALFLLIYLFAIGSYAKRTGRSGIVWGGLSLLLSPVGIWISYIASFFIKPKLITTED